MTTKEEKKLAELLETPLFTQEWNFALHGGCALVLIGQQGDMAATVIVNQERIALHIGNAEIASAALLEIGLADCLHTQRVENTPAFCICTWINAEDALLNRVDSFSYVTVEPLTIDFTDNALRNRFITLGNFMMKPTEGILRIAGNKSGFALFGDEGYTDMALDVRFRIPEKGSGTSGILLYATDVSLYDAQVKDSYFGYSLTVSRLGVTLKRACYGAVGSSSFESVPGWKDAEEGALHIELKDGKVAVYLPDGEISILTADDAKPFTHGLRGFFPSGKELTLLEYTVTPLE